MEYNINFKLIVLGCIYIPWKDIMAIVVSMHKIETSPLMIRCKNVKHICYVIHLD